MSKYKIWSRYDVETYTVLSKVTAVLSQELHVANFIIKSIYCNSEFILKHGITQCFYYFFN
jgi:hypothetical protein